MVTTPRYGYSMEKSTLEEFLVTVECLGNRVNLDAECKIEKTIFLELLKGLALRSSITVNTRDFSHMMLRDLY
jgi:hypothetical protein